MDAARALPAFQLVGASRGKASRINIPADALFFALSVDIPPPSHFAQYLCILSANGKDIFRVVSQAPAEGQPVTILVPVRGLQPGNMQLTVSGAGPAGRQTDVISSYLFDLQFTQ
jgi:hypothetical protein